ncbi:MAG: transglycosylase SLT domain-containing protein [Pseudomonadota bacterium]
MPPTRKLTYALRIMLLAGLVTLPMQVALAAGAAEHSDAGTSLARELFTQVYDEVERGNWSAVTQLPKADQQRLRSYILWPDLKAAQLRAELAGGAIPARAVEAFLDLHGALRPGRDLRYRYALSLARSGQHKRYLDTYEAYYQGRDIARLDCLALNAKIRTARSPNIAGRAEALWLTGQSQADECDPVFAWLRERGLLGEDLYRQRYALAIDAREFARARWLGKSIGPAYVERAEAWQRAADRSTEYVRQFRKTNVDEEDRERLLYAIERQTYRDPVVARALWQRLAQRYPFSADERDHIERHIALWTARDGLPDAYRLLSALPAAATDAEVLRWRARVSLREANWQRLLEDLAAMPGAEAEREEWRYWQAIALVNRGNPTAGREILAALATERSYYGFLAADATDSDYRLDATELTPDERVIDELAGRDPVRRARELFLVGLDSRGRSEWDAAVRHLDSNEKQQAAILAHRWGWHSRAIATAASAGLYDDLSLRYPLPFAEHFTAGAEAASIPANWAYGIARSESLFMRDVRSHAGAIGLMQLMPATGRQVANQLNISYNGLPTLTDPAVNIRLGTSYLGQMLERFDGNRVFATAAYNAGPHRVDVWREWRAAAEPLVWIENIPFNETRKYVRRVLAAETIFHWRMTGVARRLSASLAPLAAFENDSSVAKLGGDASDSRHLEP